MTEPARDDRYQRLIELLGEVRDLQHAHSVLYWDQQTKLPEGGTDARGNQLTTLSRLAHERFTRPEVGSLLQELKSLEDSLPYESTEASTLRVARREYERATRFPPELVTRLARARNRGYKKWLEAREARDYQVFRPALETTYELMLEVVDIIGYEDHPLDALVEEHEPGMTTAEVEALFDELRDELVPLAQAIFEREDAVEDSVLHQEFESEIQLAAARAAVEAIGFDLGRRGRLDTSVHPFSTSFSPDDVRITTRVDEDFLGQSFFAALHEAGHGTYMQGIPIPWERSILGSGASAGLHEAQSRLWENIVGRSQEFWEYFFPQLQKFFPTQLSDSTEQELYRAVNRVKPSFIRVEADEVTYNLHIMIRFELEKAVFDGELDLNDLASAWNEKYEEYLGICPPDDLVGVLQDIHWSGSFGASFQSYTIGNVASVQLYDRALSDNPDLPEQFRRGNFSPLLEWMNRNVHDKGAKFEPQELLERSTGACLTVRPYLDYLKTKFGELYKL